MLLSCQDSLHMQMVQSHPVLTKCLPKIAFLISSANDRAYIKFIKCNKQETHFQAQQEVSVPISKLTMQLGPPLHIDNTVSGT